jgi:hypothetical protein
MLQMASRPTWLCPTLYGHASVCLTPPTDTPPCSSNTPTTAVSWQFVDERRALVQVVLSRVRLIHLAFIYSFAAKASVLMFIAVNLTKIFAYTELADTYPHLRAKQTYRDFLEAMSRTSHDHEHRIYEGWFGVFDTIKVRRESMSRYKYRFLPSM